MPVQPRDDYRSDLQLLSQSQLYQELARRASVLDARADVAARDLVHDACHYAVQRTKMIMLHMRQYTLHDADHLFRVLRLMEKLIPDRTLSNLSTAELVLLILSAFFHDIGMAPSDDEVRSWSEVWDRSARERGLSAGGKKFELFLRGKTDRQREIELLDLAGDNSRAQLIREHLISEFIRHTHAERAMEILERDWIARIRYADADLAGALAVICASHNEDALRLLDEDDSLICGTSGQYVCLPFIGVILRLADLLDFDAKRTPAVLFAHLGVRHPVSLQEWQKHRSVNGWVISSERIAFSAECEHPAIEASIREFCGYIDRELLACSAVLRELRFASRALTERPEHYLIPLPARTDTSRVGPKRDIRRRPIYRYRDCRFSLERRQVIELLMGTALYGDPAVAVRELVQNAIDACMLRAAREASWGNNYRPEIEVNLSAEDGQDVLRVCDNGVGMDDHIVDNFLSRIGSSYYRSQEFVELRAKEGFEMKPISKFGIGILSCFMVADSFSFHTRRLLGNLKAAEPLEIRVEGLDSIFWFHPGTRENAGTEVRLHLRKEHPWDWYAPQARIGMIARLFPRPPFPIRVRCGTETILIDGTDFDSRIEALSQNLDGEPVRLFDVPLAGDKYFGKARVCILESDNRPVDKIEKVIDEVRVGRAEQTYVLSNRLQVGRNEVRRLADRLEATEHGFRVGSSYSPVAGSKAELALQGIHVPMDLFPGPWLWKSQPAHLVFPFAVRLIVDVEASSGLSLNAARSQVLADERWFEFAASLSADICRGVRRQVSPEYWRELVDVWRSVNGDGDAPAQWNAFLEGLQRASS